MDFICPQRFSSRLGVGIGFAIRASVTRGFDLIRSALIFLYIMIVLLVSGLAKANSISLIQTTVETTGYRPFGFLYLNIDLGKSEDSKMLGLTDTSEVRPAPLKTQRRSLN
jgi:hypothetical protein